MAPFGRPSVRWWLYWSMSASKLRLEGTGLEEYIRRMPPKGKGSSCCCSGTLEDKTAWPELLWVVMTWDMTSI